MLPYGQAKDSCRASAACCTSQRSRGRWYAADWCADKLDVRLTHSTVHANICCEQKLTNSYAHPYATGTAAESNTDHQLPVGLDWPRDFHPKLRQGEQSIKVPFYSENALPSIHAACRMQPQPSAQGMKKQPKPLPGLPLKTVEKTDANRVLI